ncbi:MAG: 50S ribosomal protein L9 [Parvularculales bacterium]
MQIILLERIEKLGQMGNMVTVKNGYARNFLLPRGKALRATKENLTRFEQERIQMEAQNLERRTEAESIAQKLEGQQFIVMRQAGETGQLYGSVTTRDLVETLTQNGFTVIRDQVNLIQPIKSLGLHEVLVRLHPEVRIRIRINVARNEEEAERQARGLSITPDDENKAATNEESISPTDVFEDEVQARLAEEDAQEGIDSDTETDMLSTHNTPEGNDDSDEP